MAGELLLDTGPLVSLLDRSQTAHKQCVQLFESWQSPIVTTEAVLTEATHLLSDVSGGVSACIEFILKGGALLIPSTLVSLQRCRALIDKYVDVPMDFADATLVVLAEELNADTIFTLDSDFRIYRIRGRKAFNLVPAI